LCSQLLKFIVKRSHASRKKSTLLPSGSRERRLTRVSGGGCQAPCVQPIGGWGYKRERERERKKH
jgi:hypothetical protein